MKISLGVSAVAVVGFLTLTGCTIHPTPVEQFYGTSFELAKLSQIANPEAGVESGPPVGLEGEIGARVIDRYKEGFESAALETTTYTLSVDGIGM
ncbi:hypothetical protein [Desulfosediminicola ganghwensis]|uniref:hypothetical protein n=1 Tax=Desulfosediminicola ganghwensis TaxID=2569540 RepID=UPI0010AC64CD|nr:hypothetical protein [Desulfosediminicola ganghwensis]